MRISLPHTSNAHVSLSILISAISFVAGAWVLQQFSTLPDLRWLFFATIFALFVLGLRIFKRWGLFKSLGLIANNLAFYPKFYIALTYFSIFLLGISVAALRAHARVDSALPHAWEQKTILLQGVVASVPEITERGERFRFDVEKILTPQAIAPKNISLNFYYQDAYAEHSDQQNSTLQETQFHAGERWKLSVKLKRPHGVLNPHGFDFEAWAMSENIRATGTIKTKAGLKRISDMVWQPVYLLEHWRESIKNHIQQVLKNAPYVGVIQALVMGDDSAIAADDWQVFLRTGTTHLISISGLHITMLAGLALLLVQGVWGRFPRLILALPARKAGTLAGVLVAVVYALVAGFSVPTQRTLTMLLVFALALWSGKKWVMSQVLAVALGVVVLLDPWAVISAGFWLSFGAVALMAYAINGRIGNLGWLKTAVLTQWAVTIGLLPILLILFNQASIMSPVANAIAIPVVSFFVTPLALIGSFFSFDIFLLAANAILNGLMIVLEYLNRLPISTWYQHTPPAWALLPAMLGVLILLLPRGIPLRFFGFFGLIPIFFIFPEKPLTGEMKVTVLDVGQGLSVVVQTARHALVYDAGPKFNTQNDAGSRIILPYLHAAGLHQLDGMVISHDDIDHSGGMAAILNHIPVRWLMRSYAMEQEEAWPRKKMLCQAGQRWVWDDVRFELLYPTQTVLDDPDIKDNNKSCVLKITSKAGSVLLTGDVEKEAENALLQDYAKNLHRLKSDVLVVPHHGSKTSSQQAFITAISPQLSIFTVGYLNRFGHPKPVIVNRYSESKNQHLLYRSDQHGAAVLDFMTNLSNQPVIKIKNWRAVHQRYWSNDVAEN